MGNQLLKKDLFNMENAANTLGYRTFFVSGSTDGIGLQACKMLAQ